MAEPMNAGTSTSNYPDDVNLASHHEPEINQQAEFDEEQEDDDFSEADWDPLDVDAMDSDATEPWSTIGPTAEQEEAVRKRKREEEENKDSDWNVMD